MPITSEKRSAYEALLQRALNARLSEVSRRGLLRNAAVAGGGLAAMGTLGFAAAQDSTPVAGEVATPAGDSPFETDADVLNFALTLEHLESAFYRDGLAEFGEAGITDLGFQASVFANLSEIAAHEAAHVEVLTGVVTDLGGTPVEEATYDFGYTDAASFLAVAQALEDTGVGAYNGAAQYLIDNDDLLTAALTIHAVEARHASYLALLNEAVPFPDAVNPFLTVEETLEIATPFIVAE